MDDPLHSMLCHFPETGPRDSAYILALYNKTQDFQSQGGILLENAFTIPLGFLAFAKEL